MKEEISASKGCQCPEIGDLFPFYLNGHVTLADAARIENHVAGCSACQKELALWAELATTGIPSWRKPDEDGPPIGKRPTKRTTGKSKLS